MKKSGLYLLSFLVEIAGGLKAISAGIKSLIVYEDCISTG